MCGGEELSEIDPKSSKLGLSQPFLHRFDVLAVILNPMRVADVGNARTITGYSCVSQCVRQKK